MRKLCWSIVSILSLSINTATAQSKEARGITMEEYKNAKTYNIEKPDEDNYAKFGNNQYIVERYEDKKPYFVTGDDGKRKRIDLYSLTKKGEDVSLGLIIYYTTETGKRYIACLPNNFAAGAVWEQYFTDIHAIDKVEANFVLKLSYILSRELSYSNYKVLLKGEEDSRAEAGTYGNDICFPGTDLVAMADGSQKLLKNIKTGDQILTLHTQTAQPQVVTVTKLIEHKAENYAITTLTLFNTVVKEEGTYLNTLAVSATPNHPMTTSNGLKNIGAIEKGESILCKNPTTGNFERFEVWSKSEKPEGVQIVYNMETTGGDTFIMNGVMVRQK
jgi:hypothetical protein